MSTQFLQEVQGGMLDNFFTVLEMCATLGHYSSQFVGLTSRRLDGCAYRGDFLGNFCDILGDREYKSKNRVGNKEKGREGTQM